MKNKRNTFSLNSIQFALLSELFRINKPRPSQYFANSLGLSSKTIRNYLSDLDQILKKYGAGIESKSGLGFWLSVDDEERFRELKEYLLKYENTDSFDEDIKAERAHLIVRELLAAEDYIKTESFMDLMYTNSTTIKQVMDLAKLILNYFGLSIVSKSRHGIRVSGSEHDIRCMIYYEFIFYDRFDLSIAKEEAFSDYFTENEDAKDVFDIIVRLQTTFSDQKLSQWTITTLSKSIYMWDKRNRKGHVLEYPEDVVAQFTNRNSYYVAKFIINECIQKLGLELTDNDVIYLTMLIVAWRTNLDIDNMNPTIRHQNKDIALDVIQHLHDVNYFSHMNKDLELIDTLALYVEGYIVRSRYHLYTNLLEGKYNDDISIMARKLAFQTLVYMHKRYGGVVNSEEIIYLSNLFRPYFGRFPHNRRLLKAAVVSRIDKLVGELIKERIERNFGSYFDKIDILELYELKGMDAGAYDIIFTSYDLEKLSFVPSKVDIVYTTTFFDEAFKLSLHRLIVSKSTLGMSTLGWILPKENILTDVSCKNQDEVILKLGKFLFPDDEEAFTKFIDELTYMETVDETKARNNAVCLTGLSSHTASITVVVIVLKKSITWGRGSKAQVIVYWDGGKDREHAHYLENEFMPHEIDEVFHDKMVIDEILTSLNYQDLIMYIDEYRWKITISGSAFK